LACGLLMVCCHVSASPPLQSDAEVALLDGRVDGDSVDHAFRRAFHKQMSQAEKHYAKQLLRNTFDKINNEATNDVKSKLYQELKANLKGADADQTEGIKQMMKETESEIKDMSQRAHKLHEGVKRILKHTNWNIDEEEHKAVLRHKKREYEREAEIESLQPLSKPRESKADDLSTAKLEALHLERSEDDLKHVFQTKCKQMTKENKRRMTHVNGLISELKLSMKAATQAFHASSKTVDQAIEGYALRRKDARMAANEVDKAEYLKNSPFNTSVPTEGKAAASGKKEDTATAQVKKTLAEDSMNAAHDIIAKAAKKLIRSQSAVHKALKALDEKKQKVVHVQMSMKQHEILHRHLKDQHKQIENLCTDPLKPNVVAEHERRFEQSVKNATRTADKNLTATNITKLLADTKAFAAQSETAAANLKQSVARIKGKTAAEELTRLEAAGTVKNTSQPVAPQSSMEDNTELQEEAVQNEQRPRPSPAPIPQPQHGVHHDSLAESQEHFLGNNISHNNGSALANGWQFGAPGLNPNATSDVPAVATLEESNEESFEDGRITQDMCKSAKMGMQILCKKQGEQSVDCVNARMQYDSQC